MPHLRPWTASILTEGLPQYCDISRTRADHSQQRTDGRCLPGAVETKEAIDLARFHAQIDTIHCQHIAVAFGKLIGFDRVAGHLLATTLHSSNAI